MNCDTVYRQNAVRGTLLPLSVAVVHRARTALAETRLKRSNMPSVSSLPSHPAAIPVARGVPLVGNLRPMTTDMHRFLIAEYLRLGPVFYISVLQHRMLVLAGPEANALMKTQGGTLFSSASIWKGTHKALDLEHPSMIELDGPDHIALRTGLKAGYSGSTLYAQMARLIDSQLRLMASWPRGQPFPVFDQVKRLVSLLLGYMATNQAPDEIMDDLIYFFRAVIQIHIQKVRPGFLQYLPRYTRSRQAVLAMARQIWDEHHLHDYPEQEGNFVDLVRQFQARHPDLMSEKDAIAAIHGPFIAGLDTAASTISFLLYQILKDPDLKRCIVAEADQAFAPGLPNRQTLRQMVKTRWAAMEILRMYPPVPAVYRTVATDFEFQGYHIPAGIPCLVAHTVTHRLAQYFPQPDCFDLERYSPERREHVQPNAYAPYGLGPHTCLGASTADLLYLIITAGLFRHFEIEMRPADQKLHIVMNPLPSPSARFRMTLVGERYPLRASHSAAAAPV